MGSVGSAEPTDFWKVWNGTHGFWGKEGLMAVKDKLIGSNSWMANFWNPRIKISNNAPVYLFWMVTAYDIKGWNC